MRTLLPAAASIGVGQAPPRSRAASTGRPLEGVLRQAAFLALAAFASVRYATLLSPSPVARALALAAASSCAGSLLAVSARLPGRRRGTAAVRAAVLVLTLAATMLLAGVPFHLLLPDAWAALARHVHAGVDSLGAWLWPYLGHARWPRTVVLLPLAVALPLASALAFWPGCWPQARRTAALAIVLGVYVTGAANGPSAPRLLQGLALMALVCAWLLLPDVGGEDRVRATSWLAASGAAALALLPVLSSSRPWIDFREAGGAPAKVSGFQWDQLYGPNPWPHSGATVARVEATQPGLLRVTSLDRFDGLRFLRSVAPPGSARLDDGTAATRRSFRERALFVIEDLRSPLLVGAGGVAERVRWLGSGAPALTRHADGTVTSTPSLGWGDLYEVSSYDPRPEATALQAAPRTYPRAYLPYAQFELPGANASALRAPDLAAAARARPRAALLVSPPAPGRAPAADPLTAGRIAASPYGPMFALARRLAAGTRTTYEVVERIEQYLAVGYGYDERVPQARYPLEAFLFRQRRGYCQQFSGAMTLMLRMDGIPARVGEGFKPALYDPAVGSWTIRAVDAHAWVEVFFSGIGWVSFDPTPTAVVPLSGTGTGNLRKAGLLGHASSAASPVQPRGAAAAASGRGRGGAFPWEGLLAGLGGLAAAGACAGVAAHLRLRRSLRGDGAGAIVELRWALVKTGADVPGATLARLERELAREGRLAAAAYVRRLREARYCAPGAAPPHPGGRGELRRALGAGGGRRARLRALLALPPGMTRRACARS
jgi:transglutaminase-like putative cysteine protease